jgi:glutathione S-transferase
MAITLYHHPFSRAAGTIWPLEEVGVPYELSFVDIMKGGTKQGDVAKANPMGKLPTLVDGDLVVTEAAAIGLYLADRYAYGKLSPKVDDPNRGTYLRWSFFAPSVIEPAATVHMKKWDANPYQVGWGKYEDVISTMEQALEGKDFILGKEFSMADCIFGGTIRFMTMFKMIEPKPIFGAYIERLNQRPALQRADAKNMEIMKAHDLKMPGSG